MWWWYGGGGCGAGDCGDGVIVMVIAAVVAVVVLISVVAQQISTAIFEWRAKTVTPSHSKPYLQPKIGRLGTRDLDRAEQSESGQQHIGAKSAKCTFRGRAGENPS